MGNRNSGRRPLPTAVQLLRGVTRADRLNPAEPQPPSGEVHKPQGLSAEAGQVWDELAPICLAMGTLTVADVRPFRMLCELEGNLVWARAWKATPRRRTAGLKLERDLAALLRPYYALFGLEPVSRAKIRVPKAETKSKWAS
jgi:hypothetical protein